MCGIAGFLAPGVGAAPRMEALVTRMADAVRHRGPDAGGTWVDAAAGIALGHRRLSILDLSDAGAQPMRSKCGRYVVTYNGEIYNAPSLRRELAAAGAHFIGHADTEVLVEALSAWGFERALARLNGMFAFAAWDRAERRLRLARDRFGEKPLYYGWVEGAFLFASELKGLRAWPGFAPPLDRAAICLLLRHGYVPEPWCVFEGLRKLAPGTWIEVSAADAGCLPTARHYYALTATIAQARSAPAPVTPEAAVDMLAATLSEAVGARMAADVPLGAFLSGGIDSSLIVALMQAHSETPVRTFSIGFADRNYDEAPYARAVAAQLGTHHTELYAAPDDALALVDALPRLYDEPFADSSQLPTCLLARLARGEVTVAMSGDGGDELFAGYTRYSIALSLWQRAQRTPRALRRLGARALREVSPAAWDRLFALAAPLLPARLAQPRAGEKLHKLARLLEIEQPLAMYLELISQWQDPARLVPGACEPPSVLGLAAGMPAGLAFVEQMMYLDTLHYLPGDLLTKVDRATMAVGLEARVPFLDPAVVALAWDMPLSCKLRGGDGKWMLRELLARHVPRALFERPKMGFGVPVGDWLRGPLRDWAEALLAPARLADADLLDPAPIRDAWRTHLAGSENLSYPLWTVLMLQAWREAWARGGP